MRRKVRISYQKEEIPDFLDVECAWRPLSEIEVPPVEHLRSDYFHRLNVLCEQAVEQSIFRNQSKGINIRYLQTIDDKIKIYVLINRPKMSVDHKILYWIVRSRLTLLLAKISGRWNLLMGKIGGFKEIEALSLLISAKPIYEYTLGTFWRTLKLLLSKINSLRWSNELEHFVACLRLCCAKFLIVQESSDVVKYLDFKLFIEEKDGFRKITLNFIKETERIFFGIEKRLHTYHLTSGFKRINVACNLGQVQILHAWLHSLISGAVYVDSIKKEFSKRVFHLDLLIGEKERYIEEEKFGEVTVQNIMAQWRVDRIDYLRSVAQRDSIEKLLKKVLKTNATPVVNIQLNELLRIMIDYKLDSLFAISRIFSSQYTVQRKLIKWRLTQNKAETPLIFREFNDYSVFFRDCVYKCRTYADCFITWIKLLCESTTFKGVFPNQNPDVNVVELYKALFPQFGDSHRILDYNLATLQGLDQLPDMPMPDFYK